MTEPQFRAFFALLVSLLVASPAVGAPGPDSLGVNVSVQAQWQLACGRSFIKQQIVITNNSSITWCAIAGVCNAEKLLAVKDDRGVGVAFGRSCGRSTAPLQSFLSRLVDIKPGESRTFYFGGPGAIIRSLDMPDENMSRARSYAGSTSLAVVKCDAARSICPGVDCSWENLAAKEIIQTISIRDVHVPYQGQSCPRKFDPRVDNADPPGGISRK